MAETHDAPALKGPTLDYGSGEFTDEEWRRNMDFYARIYSGWRDQDTLRLVPFNKLLRDHKPDMLKGWRRWAEATLHAHGGSDLPGPSRVLTSLVHYILISYPEGIEYQMRMLRLHRIRKAELLETLAFAGLHGGPKALVVATPIVAPFLDEWQEDPEGPNWTEGWTPEHGVLRSGLDFSTTELSEDEKRKLIDWHLSNEGEVPPFVQFLADHHPAGLKTYRERWEMAYGGVLPKQMPALFTLKVGIVLGEPSGVRRGVRHALASGVTRPQIVQMVAMAQEWLGHVAINEVIEAAQTALA